MTSEEKRAWILGFVSVVSFGTYLAVVRFADAPYKSTMLWAIGLSIVASIVLHIAATLRGPHEPKDERDRAIGHFGESVGNWTVVAGALTALILALGETGYFWVANALYLGFTLSAVLGSAARIVAYRRGLPGRHAW